MFQQTPTVYGHGPSTQAVLWAEQFKAWKRAVNTALCQQTGMTADDLPDAPYADWFDQRVNPRTAAKRAIRRASEF